jgi:hypothetical protein
MAGRITINGSLNELPQGTVSIGPLTLSPATENLCQAVNLTLASGANVVPIPTWATGVLIQPNPSNAVTLNVNTYNSEAPADGAAISPTAPSLLSLPASPPLNLLIIAGSAADTETTVTFF